MRFNQPYLIALCALYLFWVFYRILTGAWNPLKVVIIGGRESPCTAPFTVTV